MFPHSMGLFSFFFFGPELTGSPCFNTHSWSVFFSWTSPPFYLGRPSSNSFIARWVNSSSSLQPSHIGFYQGLPIHPCPSPPSMCFSLLCKCLCWTWLNYHWYAEIYIWESLTFLYTGNKENWPSPQQNRKYTEASIIRNRQFQISCLNSDMYASYIISLQLAQMFLHSKYPKLTSHLMPTTPYLLFYSFFQVVATKCF